MTGRSWPVTDRWLVVFDSWSDGRDLMVADRPNADLQELPYPPLSLVGLAGLLILSNDVLY